MANKSWNKWYAQCPYFQHDDGKKVIECEGVSDASRLSWRFHDTADYSIQIEAFCKDRYKNCEVYRMLEEIHKED